MLTYILQLWDVASDQEAVDLVRNTMDPGAAAKQLVDHALARFSTDNLSCMIVRFDKQGTLDQQSSKEIGVEGDSASASGKLSEAEKIINETKAKIAEGNTPAVGISASNFGHGRDPAKLEAEADFTPTAIEGSVEEASSQAVVNSVEGNGTKDAVVVDGTRSDVEVPDLTEPAPPLAEPAMGSNPPLVKS